jgi:hypothetical protein
MWFLAAAAQASPIDLSPVAGVTAKRVEASSSPVAIASFESGRQTWTLSCHGAGRDAACQVTSGRSFGVIESCQATRMTFHLGAETVTVSAVQPLVIDPSVASWDPGTTSIPGGDCAQQCKDILANGTISPGEMAQWTQYSCWRCLL